ncbi:MAG: hypothetical protein WC117_01220 [Sphaerochaetaceae bacterium]
MGKNENNEGVKKKKEEESATEVTHSNLVNLAVKWLGNNGWKVALGELRSISMEEPDALGLNSSTSCLIECKTSRADFFADKKKLFRINPEMGVGTYRYMMLPSGIIDVAELPTAWGLLVVKGSRVYKVKEAHAFDNSLAALAERAWLSSLLRRVIDEAPEILSDCVDVGKINRKIMAKKMELKNEEARITRLERRLAYRRKQLDTQL